MPHYLLLKNYLRKTHLVPKFFNTGKRLGQIYNSRIRTQSSGLNAHLFMKNLVENPFCSCGQVEDSKHFFFVCTRFREHRRQMFAKLSYDPITIDKLLFGDNNLSDDENAENFLVIQIFISKTGRFS